MVETLIYDRLRTHPPLTALVGARIFPDKPTTNTAMPFVVYSITDIDDNTTLSGTSGVKRHTLQIEVWGVNQTTTLTVLLQCKEALDNWRGGNVQGAFFVTQGTLEAEEGYQGIAVYNVWADVATVTALPDSTGTVRTGLNYVELAACGHTLIVSCSGVTIDGTPIADGSALAGHIAAANPHPQYRLLVNNTFSGVMTVAGQLNADVVSSNSIGTTTLTVSGDTFATNVYGKRVTVQAPTTGPYTTNVTLQEWRTAAGVLAARLRCGDGPANGDMQVKFDFFHPGTGVSFGSFGFENNVAAIYFASLFSAGLITANGGIAVGNYAVSNFSGPLRSYAAQPLSLEAEAGQEVRLKSGSGLGATLKTDLGFEFSNYVRFASLSDAAAPNNSQYFSTTQDALCFKRADGTVKNLEL